VSDPLISIVTATYNRSNVLRYTIESVLRSRFQRWEQIVVGDACTDDTAELVASFNEPRLRFFNLPRNVGEQSGPNNVGVTLARGRYLAFLNHDDLIFPDHLEIALEAIQATGADLVFTQALCVLAEGQLALIGATPNAAYAPHCFVPASLWLMRRELLAGIGLWQPAQSSYNVPSQALLWRAYRAKRRIVSVPRVTALVLPSGYRPGAYARRDWREHAELFSQLCDEPGFRERALEALATRQAAEHANLSLREAGRRLARNLFYGAATALGVSPLGLIHALRYGRRGSRVAQLRAIRGLPE
jgi:glycosyltransferase involved in cell wall biosynthesis